MNINFNELLQYDKELGQFYWLNSHNKNIGIAGTTNNKGYRIIHIRGKMLLVHRLVWYFEYGEFPKGGLNHKDCNKLNNNINNLELISQRQNCQRKTIHLKGKLSGCYYHKLSKKWLSRAQINKVSHYLGLHNTEQEAHNKYIEFLRSFHG